MTEQQEKHIRSLIKSPNALGFRALVEVVIWLAKRERGRK